MDSRAIAALLRLQTPLAIYQQQREAADAALRLAIEEAGFDPGVLEASVLDVPPMPLPLYDSGLSALPEPAIYSAAIPNPRTHHIRISEQVIRRLSVFGDMAIDGVPVMHLLADLAGARREAADAWAIVDNLRAEVAALKGERGEPFDANPWEGRN